MFYCAKIHNISYPPPNNPHKKKKKEILVLIPKFLKKIYKGALVFIVYILKYARSFYLENLPRKTIDLLT